MGGLSSTHLCADLEADRIAMWGCFCNGTVCAAAVHMHNQVAVSEGSTLKMTIVQEVSSLKVRAPQPATSYMMCCLLINTCNTLAVGIFGWALFD